MLSFFYLKWGLREVTAISVHLWHLWDESKNQDRSSIRSQRKGFLTFSSDISLTSTLNAGWKSNIFSPNSETQTELSFFSPAWLELFFVLPERFFRWSSTGLTSPVSSPVSLLLRKRPRETRGDGSAASNLVSSQRFLGYQGSNGSNKPMYDSQQVWGSDKPQFPVLCQKGC